MEQRWIHIDLKGLCPTIDSLKKSLKRFTDMGANGFLFEIEDMFPFEHASQSLRPDCYTLEEWADIYQTCRDLKAECVPLIQTLGHLEWLLWHEDFAHLRAADNMNEGVTATVSIYQVHPCNEEAVQLIISLIDEVIDSHGDLRYMHVGGDETWFESDDPGEEYLTHMLPIIDHVSSRGITPIIWSDMILSYFQIVDRIPERVIIADWMYSHREQFGEMPEIWGEKHTLFNDLSEERKTEFGDHLFRDLEYGGSKKHNFPYPSYFASKKRNVMVVPAGQCHGDRFSMPTLAWKFDNARAYIKEGSECGVMGCINSDWIVRRNLRELTRITHFGFLQNALLPEESFSNSEIICAYWEDISPGCGEKAVEIFSPISDVRGIAWEVTAPIGHNLDSPYWSVGDLVEKLEKDPNRPADADEETIARVEALKNGGEAVAEFCSSVLSVMSGPKGERRAEAEAWRIAGMDTAVRAMIWLAVRARQNGENTDSLMESLSKELGMVGQGFRALCEGRYLPADVDIEYKWRYADIQKKLDSAEG